MTYRSPESLIRSIMAKSQGKDLNEGAMDHMAPALKTPEEERLTAAVNILKNHGVPSAQVDGNGISISAEDANKASDVLERALVHGLIQLRPQIHSAESIPMPEPHVPAPVETPTAVQKEDVNLIPDAKQDEDQTPEGTVDDGEVKLEKRSLRNRMENQMKKVDEDTIRDRKDVDREIDNMARDILNKKTVKSEENQIDEVSKALVGRYIKKSVSDIGDRENFNGNVNTARYAGKYDNEDEEGEVDAMYANQDKIKKRKAGIDRAVTRLTKEDTGQVDEEQEQLDELSTDTLKKVANVARKKNRPDVLKAAIKAHQRNRNQPKPFGDLKTIRDGVEPQGEQQLDELSLTALTKYSKMAKKPVSPLDKKIDRRRSGLELAQKKIGKAVSKALFGENATPINMIKRVRAKTLVEGSRLRLKATIKSECGKHEAKIYKDSDYNEHRVKFFIHGKHHEPADYFTDDYHDAHGTAHAELKRMTKLNGALKESTEEVAKRGDTPFPAELEESNGITKIGSYFDNNGNTFSMHRSNTDPKHYMLTNKSGDVIDSHHGDVNVFHNKLKKDGIKGALHEAVEQLDEISDKTVKSYKTAASNDMIKRAFSKNVDAMSKIGQRKKGLAMADNRVATNKPGSTECSDCEGTGNAPGIDRHPDDPRGSSKVRKCDTCDGRGHIKESVEETLDETRMPSSVIKHKQRLGDMPDKDLADHFKKAATELGRSVEDHARQTAWRHGYGKMNAHYWNRIKDHINEEVEHINELSTNTLLKYSIKAASSRREHSNIARKKYAKQDYEDVEKHVRKGANRFTGIKRATSKITSQAAPLGIHEDVLKKKGRKKKPRHEDGEIVNDPKANGVNENIEILEGGNAENKLKKAIHIAKLGAKNSLATKSDMHMHIKAGPGSKEYNAKQMADGLKREGRRAVKMSSSEPYRASYDKSSGNYHIVHRESGKIVQRNVANSGGAALSHADRWNKKTS